MPPFTVQDIVRATQGALVAGDLGIPVTGVSIDSRSLGVGEAFFAIHGHRLDGHAFLADAAARGAACLVVDALPDDVPANVPLVLVEETTRASYVEYARVHLYPAFGDVPVGPVTAEVFGGLLRRAARLSDAP